MKPTKKHMSIRSKGLRSSLFINSASGEIEDYNEYIVVRTPSNPEFHWGNYMVFPHPPSSGDYLRWSTLFNKHFGDDQEIRHMTFTWDDVNGDLGDIKPFAENGFDIEETIVLASDKPLSGIPTNEDIVVRPVIETKEWEMVFEYKLILKPDEMDDSEYRHFFKKQMLSYRRMVERSEGIWFAGYLKGNLVCDLGLFWNKGIGRFQDVFTCPDARRQKACRTTMDYCIKYAFHKKNLKTLIIEAEENSIAEKIYESMGFVRKEKLVGICKW